MTYDPDDYLFDAVPIKSAEKSAERTGLEFDRYQFFNSRGDLQQLKQYVADAETKHFQYMSRSAGVVHVKPAWMMQGREAGEAYLRKRIENIRPGLDKEETLHRWLVILMLYYYQGLSARDIAEELKMTIKAVQGVIGRLSCGK